VCDSLKLVVFGMCPKLIKMYLVAGDALTDDFSVFVDPYIGGSAEHALADATEHNE
jgi:hypothetical protein